MDRPLVSEEPAWGPKGRCVEETTVLADTGTEMLQAFGAWGEKKMYGKTVLGTLRRTFIFSEDGILERIIEKVDTKNAAAQVLE